MQFQLEILSYIQALTALIPPECLGLCYVSQININELYIYLSKCTNPTKAATQLVSVFDLVVFFWFLLFFQLTKLLAHFCAAQIVIAQFSVFGGIQCNGKSHKTGRQTRQKYKKTIRNTHKMRLIVALSAVAHNTLFLLIFCHLQRFLSEFFRHCRADNRALTVKRKYG